MSGWGEGTYGEEAQDVSLPRLSSRQFTPDKSMGKSLSVEEHARRVNRLVSTYMASSPEQRRQGNEWYNSAHRAAVTVAKGEEPGVIPEGKLETRAIKRGVYKPPSVSDEAVERASGAIARLSPSMPAGMSWRHNPQAAYEASKLSPEEVSKVTAGKRPRTEGLKHAGAYAVEHASAILRGDVTPEEDLNQHIGRTGKVLDSRGKIGSFKRNITDPAHSREVTVDARSAGIAAGKRVSFDEVGKVLGVLHGQRYRDYEAAHQEATDIVNQHLKAAGSPPIMPHQLQATTWIADKDAQTWRGSYGSGNRHTADMPFGQEKTGDR